MSTWINKRRILLAMIAGGTLAACQMTNPLAGATAALLPPERSKPVLDGAVMLAAPRGYCIEPGSVQEMDDSAVALFGPCGLGARTAPAVLTATLGPAGTGAGLDPTGGAGAELVAFFTSDSGRAALARSGHAADVQVATAAVDDQSAALLVQFTDASPDDTDLHIQPQVWRAVLPVAGRLATLSVAGPARQPLTPDQGRALAAGFATAMRRANPVR